MTTQLLAARYIWILGYRNVKVLFGTCVFLKAELRKGAEEIRLVQIGLCIDNLVELFDREHIFLEIERIAPYYHHSRRVQLSIAQH